MWLSLLDICIDIMQLLTVSVCLLWLLSPIHILGNGPCEPILVFCAFFRSLLWHILNNFKNILRLLLVFWACV